MHPKYVVVARRAVGGLATRTSLTDEQIREVELAVGEACGNAVRHGAHGLSGVQVVCAVDGGELRISIQSPGEMRSPAAGLPSCPPAETLPEGGMGLFVISQMMDHVEIVSNSGQTSLHMVKRFTRC